MPIRNGQAVWDGGFKRGTGQMRTGSGACEGSYSAGSRFEEEPGTNPDELIGAALSGCFSMALALNLEQTGHPPERIETTARVHVDKGAEGYSITLIELQSRVRAPGVSEALFQEQAEETKKGCPVSRALAGTQITLQASLET